MNLSFVDSWQELIAEEKRGPWTRDILQADTVQTSTGKVAMYDLEVGCLCGLVDLIRKGSFLLKGIAVHETECEALCLFAEALCDKLEQDLGAIFVQRGRGWGLARVFGVMHSVGMCKVRVARGGLVLRRWSGDVVHV